jgi:hypothetical protein
MVLSADDVFAAANDMESMLNQERTQLDVLRLYSTGKQRMPIVIPQDAPVEVREMARISRINLIKIVIESLVESLFVDNFRSIDPPANPEDDPAQAIWAVWQANRFDAKQSALYRAVFEYGYAYERIVPGVDQRTGEKRPVMRAVSPRRMTALYVDDNDDWPAYTFEKRRRGRHFIYELTDEQGLIYTLGRDDKGRFGLIGDPADTGLGYNPTVRFMDAEDLDLEDEPVALSLPAPAGNETCVVAGQVAPLMTLQDQADMTTFALKGAEWYSAFRQRYIKGWTPGNRGEKMRMGASQVWSFEDHPDDIELGEFNQTELSGFLNSRAETARFVATLSQTPVHELIGELVNLSAEALAAAEAGRDRKTDERKTGMGESHEQSAQCIGDLIGVEVPDDFEVVWRDTSARAFSAVVDALGKLAQMLQIPPQMLWDRIPGFTRQDVERAKLLAAQGDSLGQLTSLLDRQAGTVNPGTPQPGETQTQSGLILPPGTRT